MQGNDEFVINLKLLIKINGAAAAPGAWSMVDDVIRKQAEVHVRHETADGRHRRRARGVGMGREFSVHPFTSTYTSSDGARRAMS